ncbi:hypothetical protein EV702DRAFT_104275 [Suillus placidus]|uniref:Uncharacterized protein n=1 Tax=Suillus placidus TaxID=48579 RepID=A0A9P6ZZB6_9AGAM|nr:hypothetical protein EV702DRAFT_104275 [Suillus placidus]
MLRWLVLFHRKPGYAPPRPSCQAHAWVRAPDMVPGDVIAGDARVKLDGPGTEVKSYELGLHYKEKIFWKLRPESEYRLMGANRDVFRRARMPFQNSGNPRYNEMQLAMQQLAPLQDSGQNKDLRSVHEEERIAFQIKAPLVGAEGAGIG